MPHIISPIRILRSRRTSFQDTEEAIELDFNFGLEQGALIHAVEFGLREYVLVPVDDSIDTESGHMSLHQETGALEGGIDAFPADDTVLNSEIIAETTLQVSGFTSSVPSTSPDILVPIWLQPIAWNFHALIDAPLLIAQNLTFRGVTSAAVLTFNGAQVTIYYQYVKLSKDELASQFVLRR